jgi:hypothetical protein
MTARMTNGLLDSNISDDEDQGRSQSRRFAPVTRSISTEARAIVSGAGFGSTPRQLRMCDFGCPLPRPGHLLRGDNGLRQQVLFDTLRAFEEASPTARYHVLAQQNRLRWKAAAMRARPPASPVAASAAGVPCRVVVLPGDWGVVTLQMTRKYGATFACLNMANAFGPGGGYTDGMVAQEENMFRRTDCHFAIEPEDMDESRCQYVAEDTELLSAVGGRVYLDVERPRVCIRGAEDRTRADLGYAWLEQDQVCVELGVANERVGGRVWVGAGRGGGRGRGGEGWTEGRGEGEGGRGCRSGSGSAGVGLRFFPPKAAPSPLPLFALRVLTRPPLLPTICLLAPQYYRPNPPLASPFSRLRVFRPSRPQIFPFYELRAAAVDLRDGSPFDTRETALRIGAQLDTLIERGAHPTLFYPSSLSSAPWLSRAEPHPLTGKTDTVSNTCPLYPLPPDTPFSSLFRRRSPSYCLRI